MLKFRILRRTSCKLLLQALERRKGCVLGAWPFLFQYLGALRTSRLRHSPVLPNFLRFKSLVPFLFALLLLPAIAWGQDVEMTAAADAEQAADTVSVNQWITGLRFDLSATQVGFQNWAEGGTNSFSVSTRLDGHALRGGEDWRQSYRIRLGFGVINQEDDGFRKSEDIVRLAAAFLNRGERGFFHTFQPTISAELRTQFASGFNFREDPFGEDRDPPVKVSEFFSPATITQSVGLTYEPISWFQQRLGVGAKQTVVAVPRLRELYGVDPDSPIRFQLGMQSDTNVDVQLAENIRYISGLTLFAAFDQDDLPDMLWENQIRMSVNSFLDVRFEFTAFFDRDVSRALQMKEVLAVGVSFDLI